MEGRDIPAFFIFSGCFNERFIKCFVGRFNCRALFHKTLNYHYLVSLRENVTEIHLAVRCNPAYRSRESLLMAQ